MNKLYQEMTQNNQSQPQYAQMKQMMNALRNSKNPQQLFMNMVGSNPQVKQILQMIQESGKSPKDLFYMMAEQKGADPNKILGMLQ